MFMAVLFMAKAWQRKVNVVNEEMVEHVAVLSSPWNARSFEKERVSLQKSV